jgi:hypothetical protein
MRILSITLLSLTLVAGLAVGMVTTPIQAAGPLHQGDLILAMFIGGTVEEIDHAGLQVTILTEMGKKESLPVANADVIKGLAKGDRVNVEMDEQGKVKTIVKTSPEKQIAPEPRG